MTTDTVNTVAQDLALKLRGAEEQISKERGEFVLFALFEREQTPDRWDLLVSAPWLRTDRAGVSEMIHLLSGGMDTVDWTRLASITPLDPAMNYVQWIARRYNLAHGLEEVTNAVLDGVSVSRGYIITAKELSNFDREPLVVA